MPRDRAVFVISGLVVMLMAAVAHPAGAGTIDVGGTVTFPGLIIDLVGNRGFTANGLSDTLVQGLGACTPCMPGQPIILSTTLRTEDLFGVVGDQATVTLEGTTYHVGGQLVSDLEPRLTLAFTAPTLFAPPVNVAPIVALTTPVSVSGTFVHHGVVEELGATASATLVLQRSGFGELWDARSATYDLTATPEPATLLLFGTTMAGLALTRWRRRGQN